MQLEGKGCYLFRSVLIILAGLGRHLWNEASIGEVGSKWAEETKANSAKGEVKV